jgi:Fe-S cluster assembly protein SufD
MIDTLDRKPDLVGRIRATISDFNGHEADDPLATRRKAASAALERLGLPTRKSEAWKYTPIEKALRHEFAPLAVQAERLSADDAAALRLPDLDPILLVVVNGVFAAELSDAASLPDGVEASSLLEALSEDTAMADAYFARLADAQKDVFVAMNTAVESDGVFLRVADGTALHRPIQVAYVNNPAGDAAIQPRSLYLFGVNSEAMVVETFHSASGARTFTNTVTEVYVERDARINILKLQIERDDAVRVDSTHVVQVGSSYFAGHTYTLGGGLVRNNMTVAPSAERCESHLYGLYILRGDQHVDNQTLIDHAAAGCFSNELYRGVVDERSTGVFNGKVFVRRDSQQTNAYQSSQGVVLSEDAHHYSKPELEIYADDVKCSHGSTTGELEPEHVFYLRSRGIDEATAKSLLLYAFAHDIVEQLPNEALRDYLDELIEERLIESAAR